MEVSKQIRIRLAFLLIVGCASVMLGFYYLTKGGESDIFAVANFFLAGMSFFIYHRMKSRFFPNKEKAWRSYR